MLHNHLTIALIIFTLTYGAIVSEKINRTAVALLGAVLMLIFKVISQDFAFEVIDFNTLGLLIGMMIIVNILKRTGIFQYLAIRTAKKSNGDPWRIILLFSVITALSSALLDNVTTILLIAPVTLVITDTLNVNPIPFLIPEILAANIGGTTTLIGDPPNIMIGGATNLGFIDFIVNLFPVVLVIFIITLFLLKLIFRNSLKVNEENKRKIASLSEEKAIKDKVLLIKSISVLILTMIGFTVHQILGFESATIAMFGAAILLLISNIEPEEILLEVEWPTIFFFAALFILVGALEEVGVIKFMATKLIKLTKGNTFVTTMLILWLSAIASSFLDNIPFVATMIPLIKNLEVISDVNLVPLWWALALGACLGGNGTLVGASANVIVAGILERRCNKLSFAEYMKVGFPLMIVSIILSSIYLIVFYL
ncbi:ArsB/NhaD family transporter [Crassaminicella thermophila]|uniref:ArsB/NhaD family transporter n=1 Tax=Crassaminicella thermophila TaxID=2599308 RepID=A0A5C0SD03_CRATE|nr:ArsB/NhaD family transporter [Crassaminicella thermophila]QEK12415.1 ArsB/NhaD family transporter [Crassaminicella thermophila]